MSDRDMLGDEVEGIDDTTKVDTADVVVSLQNDVATLQKQRALDRTTFTDRIAALEARVAELEHRLGDALAAMR